MGPIARVDQFNLIETTMFGGNLQQSWWATDEHRRLARGGAGADVILPGAHSSDPEFSWKFDMAPAGIGFMNGRGIGPQDDGDLFVGAARTTLHGGPLFHFNLTGNRRKIGVDDPRLEDRVADNLDKFDITESESLLFGTSFGIGTDIKTGPEWQPVRHLTLERSDLRDFPSVVKEESSFRYRCVGEKHATRRT